MKGNQSQINSVHALHFAGAHYIVLGLFNAKLFIYKENSETSAYSLIAIEEAEHAVMRIESF